MYKCINGWTKEKMKEQIKKYNNGTCSYDEKETLCYYKNHADNNRCAVGCFIPDKFEKALDAKMPVSKLLDNFLELDIYMPLELKGLSDLQSVHDGQKYVNNMHDILSDWIDKNVED